MNITQESNEARKLPEKEQIFHTLLKQVSVLHQTKSHDYANDESPYANYEFAGIIAHQLFKESPLDIGFCCRVAEKLYRISNLESNGKNPNHESIDDTELDIVALVTLWMSARRDKRNKR